MTYSSPILNELANIREELAALAKVWFDSRQKLAEIQKKYPSVVKHHEISQEDQEALILWDGNVVAAEDLMEEKVVVLREAEEKLKEAYAKDQLNAQAWDDWRDSLVTSVKEREAKVRDVTAAECSVLHFLLQGLRAAPEKASDLIAIANKDRYDHSLDFAKKIRELEVSIYTKTLSETCDAVENWLMD